MNSVANGLVDISHSWYETAFRELNRSQFFSKPQLSTVQALAILMILHRNFGESHREYFLLGLAVNTARTLGMDHLGQEGSNIRGMSTRPEWNNRSEREVGRRLWWTLVICDW
jgi:Fungal specific transcription factor domain